MLKKSPNIKIAFLNKEWDDPPAADHFRRAPFSFGSLYFGWAKESEQWRTKKPCEDLLYFLLATRESTKEKVSAGGGCASGAKAHI